MSPSGGRGARVQFLYKKDGAVWRFGGVLLSRPWKDMAPGMRRTVSRCIKALIAKDWGKA